jgi:6-phosphogluconolactonase (cycloisomerase 2 family)
MSGPVVLVCSCTGVGMDPAKARPGTIQTFRLDPRSAQLEPLCGPIPAGRKVQWAAGCPSKCAVYVLENDSEMDGKLKAYHIDGATGRLSYLNEITMGCWACHCQVDLTGRWVIANDYGKRPGAAHVAAFSILPDGQIGPAASRCLCDPESTQDGARYDQDPGRQDASHPHMVCLDPTNRFLLVPDLGQDLIVTFSFDAATGDIRRLPTMDSARTHPGSGPRHVCFHSDGRYAFSVNELDSTVTPFLFDADAGGLIAGEECSCLPPGFDCAQNGPWGESGLPSHAAAITCVGEFVYASNRGSDTIATFQIIGSGGGNNRPPALRHIGDTLAGGALPWAIEAVSFSDSKAVEAGAGNLVLTSSQFSLASAGLASRPPVGPGTVACHRVGAGGILEAPACSVAVDDCMFVGLFSPNVWTARLGSAAHDGGVDAKL